MQSIVACVLLALGLVAARPDDTYTYDSSYSPPTQSYTYDTSSGGSGAVAVVDDLCNNVAEYGSIRACTSLLESLVQGGLSESYCVKQCNKLVLDLGAALKAQGAVSVNVDGTIKVIVKTGGSILGGLGGLVGGVVMLVGNLLTALLKVVGGVVGGLIAGVSRAVDKVLEDAFNSCVGILNKVKATLDCVKNSCLNL